MRAIRKEEEIVIEQDTIRLLRECDAGIEMGTSSIDDVLEATKDKRLRQILQHCRDEHTALKLELEELLLRFQDEGKEPSAITQGMSRMKTGVKLAMDESDATVADLITDGCNMGVKSLSRYLNQYKAADERSKDLAKRLIHMEERLAVDVRPYL